MGSASLHDQNLESDVRVAKKSLVWGRKGLIVFSSQPQEIVGNYSQQPSDLTHTVDILMDDKKLCVCEIITDNCLGAEAKISANAHA